MSKKDDILRLIKEGVKRKEIAAQLNTSLSNISHTARVAGIFGSDSKTLPRAIEYIKEHPYMPLNQVATSLHMSTATVSIAAANIGLKRFQVRRNPTEQEWACLNLWLQQKSYSEIGDIFIITRQRAQQATLLCCAKLGLQRYTMQYVRPISD